MSAVVKHPNCSRPLPRDAIPIGRECSVLVYPHDGAWDVLEISESGASYLGDQLPKNEALRIALDFVRKWNAELTLSNVRGGG